MMTVSALSSIGSLTGLDKEKKGLDATNGLFAELLTNGANNALAAAAFTQPGGAFATQSLEAKGVTVTQGTFAAPISGGASKPHQQTEAYKNGSDVVRDFLDFANKTPGERMRDQILKELGMTEEELAALPPEERAKIEEVIAAKIKEKIEEEAAKPKTTKAEEDEKAAALTASRI